MSAIEQLAWDFAALEEKPGYKGRAPLHFTVEVFTIAELKEAWEQWREENDNFDCLARSHMWVTHEGLGSTPGHGMCVFSASLGCEHYREPHSCVTSFLDRVVCECGWASAIRERSAGCIEEWHDHAWPGWRDLPVVPESVPVDVNFKPNPAHTKWLKEHYPKDWGQPGAPVVTERSGRGTRHVPGRSKWGGYDLSSTALA